MLCKEQTALGGWVRDRLELASHEERNLQREEKESGLCRAA